MTRQEKEKLIMQGRKEQHEGVIFPSLSDSSDLEIDVLYKMYKRDGTVLG